MKNVGLRVILSLVIVLVAVLSSAVPVSAAKPQPSSGGTTASISVSIDWVIPDYNLFYVSYSWKNYDAYGVNITIVDNNYNQVAGSVTTKFAAKMRSYSYPYAPVAKSSTFTSPLDTTHSYTVTLKVLGMNGNTIAQTTNTYTPR